MPGAQKDLEFALKGMRDSIVKIDAAGEEAFGKREWDRMCEEGRRTGRFGPNPAEDPFPWSLTLMGDPEEAAIVAYVVATDRKLYEELMDLSSGELIDKLRSSSILDASMLPDKMNAGAWAKARTRLLQRNRK